MELNKKLFLTILAQIKATKDVIILQDSSIDGCIDILYAPKTSDNYPRCINKMTIYFGGTGIDFFNDNPTEKLGDPVPVYLSRMKEILKGASSCVIEKGNLNGIRVEIGRDDMAYPMLKYIKATYDDLSTKIKITASASVTMRQVDYSYMVSELTKFVSKDETRYFMNGICFDFEGSELNTVNIAATDGRKLCLMKHNLNGQKKGSGKYIIPPAYLFVPLSYFNSAQLKMTEKASHLSIHTENYNFESLFNNLEGSFPSYLKVIPEITEKTQWFTLCAASFRMAIDSVKSLMDKRSMIYLNAENPESLSITVAGTTLEVEGTASRPMHVSFFWEHLRPCLFDEIALTKFYLDGSNLPIHSHGGNAMKKITMNVLKLFMPTQDGTKDPNEDEFRILKIKPAEETPAETITEF